MIKLKINKPDAFGFGLAFIKPDNFDSGLINILFLSWSIELNFTKWVKKK